LTPGLLRELYGVHADDILEDTLRPEAALQGVPMPQWSTQVAQAA
jgi:hypothetical protein